MTATVGLDGIRIGILDDNEKVTEIIEVKGAIEAKIDPSTNTDVLYADNGAFAVFTSLGETKVTLNVADLTTEQKNKILGVRTENGLELTGADTVPPFVALAMHSKGIDQKEDIYVGLLKGRFGIPSIDAKTNEDKTSAQTPEIEGTFINRQSDGLSQVIGRSGNPDFTLTEFDAKVFPPAGTTQG
ncbi:major tail protein [Bacillus smithii]|uniref:major tail protein n=1 Tax=Bacillus smithii TaxID=1479 RepID=UPI003D24DEC1